MKSRLDKINEEFIRDGASKITEGDIATVLGREKEIAGKMTGPLEKFVEEIKLFFMMLNDYWLGQYREIPWWCISAVTFAILYVLNPLDLIPDFIPLLGQIDDAAVVFLCWRMIGNDIKKYKKWKDCEDAVIDISSKSR